MSSIEIVRAARKGNPEAFTNIIKLYEKDLYRIAKAMLRNDDDALDCIQETLLKAYKGIKSLTKEEYFKTWLIKILINSCNSFMSKRDKSYTYIDITAEEVCINHDKIGIEEALQKLDEEMRLPIILYYFEDMSINDIVEVLKVPEGTVKSRLSRARKKLKDLLEYKERGVV